MMPAKIREIQFLWIWPLQSILSSPAAMNASLKSQITRSLNIQESSETWDFD